MILIKVPATTANIGPGFDTLGLAFKMYHEISVEKSSISYSNVIWINPAQALPDQDNYVIHGINAVFAKFQKVAVPFQLVMSNCAIPASRGLGSSAAAYISGIVAGLYLIDEPLDKEVILKIASDLEGHPDNVAPAVFGGMIAACMTDNRILWQPIKVDKPVQFIALIPDFKLSTHEARSAMPETYTKAEVVFNLSRLSILISALQNGNYELLRYGTQD